MLLTHRKQGLLCSTDWLVRHCLPAHRVAWGFTCIYLCKPTTCATVMTCTMYVHTVVPCSKGYCSKQVSPKLYQYEQVDICAIVLLVIHKESVCLPTRNSPDKQTPTSLSFYSYTTQLCSHIPAFRYVTTHKH